MTRLSFLLAFILVLATAVYSATASFGTGPHSSQPTLLASDCDDDHPDCNEDEDEDEESEEESEPEEFA